MFIPYATEGRLDRKLDAWKEREKVGFDFFSVRYLSTFLCQQKSVKVQRVEPRSTPNRASASYIPNLDEKKDGADG